MVSLVNTLRKQVDIHVWEYLQFLPAVSSAPSTSCAANNSNYNALHGRYIYFLYTVANFWRYDTWTDTYEQLQTPAITPATWTDMEFSSSEGPESFVLAATSTTVTIPAYTGQAVSLYDLRIIGGTGVGQRRSITSVSEPVVADTGVATSVSNVLGTISITDSTKTWIPNQWAGYQVRISAGSGVGQVRRILYNTATVITMGDSTLSAQNIWANPNIYSPAISNTAGSQSVYSIESSVVTVDEPWLVTPDTTSQFRLESGTICLASSAAATPWFTMQYYDILGDFWYIKTSNTLVISAVGTDGTIKHVGPAATTWARGNVTSVGSTTTLTDSTKSWTTNQWAGYYCNFIEGTGEGQLTKIVSNTNTTLTFAAVTSAPDTTTDYTIEGFDCGTVSTGSSTTVTDSTKAWPINRWSNFSVKIMYGTGKGQVAQILNNTATALTLVKPFSVATDTTSTYAIIPDSDKVYMMLGGQASMFLYNYNDDLLTLGRLQDSGTATNAVVLYSTARPIGIASATHATTVATITTSFPHCLKVGYSVTVKNMTDSNYNTTATITSVPSTTTFTYTMAGTPAADTVAGAQSTSTLCDSTKSWTVDQWAGYQVWMTVSANTAASGLATGQAFQILSNTANTLTFITTGTAPVTGRDRYIITPRSTPGFLDGGLCLGTQSTTQIQDNGKASSLNASFTSGSTTMTVNAVTCTASFATTVMTLQTEPTNGLIQIGNLIMGTGIPGNCTIVSLASGTLNVVGSTYSLSQTVGTVGTETVQILPAASLGAATALNATASSGGQMSFATNVATLTTQPTTGSIAIGQVIQGAGGSPSLVAGAVIVALASGTLNATSSTYTLDRTVGTVAAEAVTTSNVLFSTGGSASFATNQMTLTVSPTVGSVSIGQFVISAGVAAGTTITGLVSGNFNAIGSVYSLSTSPGTIAAQSFQTSSGMGSFGGSASFATNVMTITTAPTVGALAIGQVVTAGSVMAGTTITALLSGTLNASGSTYSLSTYPGTVGSEAFTTSGLIPGSQIVQQLTSSMANGIWGYAGTYQMSQPAPLTMTNAELSFGWVVNGLAGRKAKVLTGAGSGNTSEVSITSNTNNTITMAATGVAPVTAQSAYVIIQQPARGTGVNLLPSFGLSNIANNQGKFLYIARGGAAYGFDRLDITTDYFFMLNTHPMTETLTTGSQYAYDGGNRIYFTKEVTNRCYYLDMLTNGIHGAGMYPYTAGTALLGNRMEIFSTADNLKYLWIHRQTFTECFRQLLFY